MRIEWDGMGWNGKGGREKGKREREFFLLQG
jgi:hypothetical protein